MIRFTCPKCYKDTYTANTDVFTPCPYCGCIFSGKYGIEKRKEKRIKQKIAFLFRHKEKEFNANTVDFSDSGLGIEIFSVLSLFQDDTIEITLRDQKFKAKIIWIKKLHDKLLSGLKKLN